MIWYGSELPNAPDLHWNKPFVSQADKDELIKTHPMPVPAHCKPWIDGQSAGLVIVWPYDDAMLRFDERGAYIEDGVLDGIVHNFAIGHFSIQPRYFLRTQENVGLLTIPDPRSALYEYTVQGLIETDWYSPAPFFVFRNTGILQVRRSFEIRHGDPLLQVVPMIIDKGLQRMTDGQLKLTGADANEYFSERLARRDLLWTSALGQGFSKLYKAISRERRTK